MITDIARNRAGFDAIAREWTTSYATREAAEAHRKSVCDTTSVLCDETREEGKSDAAAAPAASSD